MAERPREPLRCQHCGTPVLPIDPGYTLRETAKMLRITPAYVSKLISVRAPDLDPPVYRRLAGHPRLYRLLSSRDVQRLNALLISNAVKSQSHAWTVRRAVTPSSSLR